MEMVTLAYACSHTHTHARRTHARTHTHTHTHTHTCIHTPEKVSLLKAVDATLVGNGHLDLFEIIMYMQKFYEHLFLKTDEKSGMKVVDEERLKKFATLLRDSVDKGLVVYVCVFARVCACVLRLSVLILTNPRWG